MGPFTGPAQFAHDPTMATRRGSVVFDFQAEDTSGLQGLFSKDANGPGSHLACYLEEGEIVARFQDSAGNSETLRRPVAASQGYTVALHFAPGDCRMVLNGDEYAVGQAPNILMDTNTEYVTVGCLGWHTAAGQPGTILSMLSGTVMSTLEIRSGD